MTENELAVATAPEQAPTAAPVSEPDNSSPEPTPTDAPKTFSQEELDAIVGKRLAREQRKWEREQARKQTAQTPAPPPEPLKPDDFTNARASRVLLDGLRHIDFLVAEDTFTHHAVLELAGDRVNGVEETLHAFDQTRVGRRVHRGVAVRHHGSVLVQLLLGLKQDKRSGRGRAGGADGREDRLVGVGNVSVDGRRKLRNTRLQHALGKVVELHGEFGRRKVHADVLLVVDGERGELLVVVLNLKGGTVGDQSAVGQTDAEGRTDLGAFDSETIIIVLFNAAR